MNTTSISKFSIFTALVAMPFLIVGCAGPITAGPQASRQEVYQETLRQQELVYERMVKDQAHIADIAFPLLTANAGFCKNNQEPLLGISAWNLGTIKKEYRQAANNIFGVDNVLSVKSVARNSPAARAGVKGGDKIIAIDGATLPEGVNGIKAASQILKNAGYNKSTFILQRNGQSKTVTMAPTAGCGYPVLLDYNSTAINAYADGEKIVISRGIVRFAENDNEIAMVIAHELGHSAMQHVNKMQQNATMGALGGFAIDTILSAVVGVGSNGQFAQLGGQMATQRYSVPFEQEADYIGLYFMERAGYNSTGVANFWRRMAAEGESSITLRTTHPSSPERFLALERTHDEIATKKKRGQNLTPNLQPQR